MFGVDCSQYIIKMFQMLKLRHAQATAQAKMKVDDTYMLAALSAHQKLKLIFACVWMHIDT